MAGTLVGETRRGWSLFLRVRLRYRWKGESLRSCSQVVGCRIGKKPIFLDTLVTKPQGLSIKIILEGEQKKLIKFLEYGSVE